MLTFNTTKGKGLKACTREFFLVAKVDWIGSILPKDVSSNSDRATPLGRRGKKEVFANQIPVVKMSYERFTHWSVVAIYSLKLHKNIQCAMKVRKQTFIHGGGAGTFTIDLGNRQTDRQD